MSAAASIASGKARLAVSALVFGLLVVVTAVSAAEPRRSGFADMGPAVQAMQRDDLANPGMLWVADGEALWQAKAGRAARACRDCHASAAESMRGVAARHPAFDARSGRPVNLAQRINQCRERQQQAPPLPAESRELLALETYVALQSRGMPIAPDASPGLAPFLDRGKRFYRQRIGQLDLSCAQCHDERAGDRLGGSLIPQAHPVGYPVYRLEWQAQGSLGRRIRGCMTGVRAEPFAWDDVALVELELFLAARAAGMPMESPAVRP